MLLKLSTLEIKEQKRFNENMDSIKDAISELLREDFEVTSDIPREMQNY